MSETMSTAQAPEHSDAVRGKVAFSYCCECGTYDAHTTACTCCGFDFRADALDPNDE